MVCGKVQGKNSLGGYAQPAPFIGSLVPTSSGAMMFLVLAIASSDPAEQARTLQACADALK